MRKRKIEEAVKEMQREWERRAAATAPGTKPE
jgi:hypothetical protein